MAMVKSTRNPLSKQLPAVRRKKSDVQPSAEITCISMEDVSVGSFADVGSVTADDEQLQSSESEIASAVSSEPGVGQSADEMADEIPVCAPSDGQKEVSGSGDKASSSFQSEFLRMLLQMKRQRSGTSQHWPKLPKLNRSSSKKMSGHGVSVPGKLAITPAKPQGMKQPAKPQGVKKPKIGSQSTMTVTQETDSSPDGYLKDGVQCMTEQTNSLTCPVSAAESSDNELVSSDMQESGRGDVFPSLEIPDSSTCAAATSASCGAAKYDDQSDTSSSAVPADTDISPPDLSLPDPEIDVDTGPPVLERYDGSADECPSSAIPPLSDTISAEVSDTSSGCGHTDFVQTSDYTDNELQKEQQCPTLIAGTNSADVMDTADVSVSTSVICSSDSMTVCSVSSEMTVSESTPSTAANAQQHCPANSSSADLKPAGSFRFSALARFRPAFSATAVLPPVDPFSNRKPRLI